MKNVMVAILLLMSVSAFSQLSVTPYFRVDASNAFSTNHNFRLDVPTLGYTAGYDFNYQFTPNWSIKTGVMYQKMGNKSERAFFLNDNDVFESRQFEITHNYVSIPLQAQYNFRAGKRFSPYIAFGGMLSYNTTNFLKQTNFREDGLSSNSVTGSLIEINGGEIRDFNIGAKVDFGFDIKLTENLSLNTFMSYNTMLLPTSNSATPNLSFNKRHFNFGGGIGLKYSF